MLSGRLISNPIVYYFMSKLSEDRQILKDFKIYLWRLFLLVKRENRLKWKNLKTLKVQQQK